VRQDNLERARLERSARPTLSALSAATRGSARCYHHRLAWLQPCLARGQIQPVHLHNTLTFDNDGDDNSNRGACDQVPGMTGRTQITLFKGNDTGSSDVHTASSSPAFSIVDLTAAYSPQNSSRVERGFAFTKRYEQLLIVDEFEFDAGAAVHNVTWSMHTSELTQVSNVLSCQRHLADNTHFH
jgi:hypothetical protein